MGVLVAMYVTFVWLLLRSILTHHNPRCKLCSTLPHCLTSTRPVQRVSVKQHQHTSLKSPAVDDTRMRQPGDVPWMNEVNAPSSVQCFDTVGWMTWCTSGHNTYDQKCSLLEHAEKETQQRPSNPHSLGRETVEVEQVY